MWLTWNPCGSYLAATSAPDISPLSSSLSPSHCRLPAMSVRPAPFFFPSFFFSLSSSTVTGTLFGYRKGRVSLSVQENPRCLPTLVVELAMRMLSLQKEMATRMVRITMEYDKRNEKEKIKLLEEPVWTMYSNVKKTSYGVRREPTKEDLNVMELLKGFP